MVVVLANCEILLLRADIEGQRLRSYLDKVRFLQESLLLLYNIEELIC